MTIGFAFPLPFGGAWKSAGVQDAVARMCGARPVSISLERTHFPGKRPVQFVLQVQLPGGWRRTVLAESCAEDPHGHAASVRASLSKSRHGQKAGLGPNAVEVAADEGLVLRRPGLDERLPGLRLLHDRDFARKALGAALGRDLGPVEPQLVAHRLGKRAVLRVSGEGLEVYVRLRVIKGSEGDTRLSRHQDLWRCLGGCADLRIPEPLGALPDIGAAVFGVLPGVPADFMARDSAAIGRAIAALQALDPEGLPVHAGADEARLLSDWLERCNRFRPDVSRRIWRPLIETMGALADLRTAPLPCHRDLHEKQILIADGAAGLLDFDTLCLSDPALDGGNLLAHLFLAGFDEAPLRGQLGMANLGLWRRAALLRLAMIYAFTSTPQAVLDRLIEEASADVRN